MNESLKHKFSRRLKQLRVGREMSQEDLAELTGISVEFISNLERARSAPSFVSLEKLARALGVEVYLLFKFD